MSNVYVKGPCKVGDWIEADPSGFGMRNCSAVVNFQGRAVDPGKLQLTWLILGKVYSLEPRWSMKPQIFETDVTLVQFDGIEARARYQAYKVCRRTFLFTLRASTRC